MTGRRLRGLDAVRNAAAHAASAIYVLNVGDVPRTGLSVREVAASTGLPVDRIYREIHAGRIRVITGGNAYVIPVSELAAITSWAEYVAT